jgi:hypothetical protein
MTWSGNDGAEAIRNRNAEMGAERRDGPTATSRRAQSSNVALDDRDLA